MCGIAGIIMRDKEAIEPCVVRMVEAQRHRGPDHHGHTVVDFGAQGIGLGHTRLSIIDLSEAGHQPMVHPETGDILVYNGEIYNFRELRADLEATGCVFRGDSDSEVLLQGLSRFGPSFIDRLEGMYAFGFLSKKKGELILARDPLGIKPLYVGRGRDGAILFASEVRAIVSSGLVDPTPCSRAVGSYLAFGAVQEPDTIVDNISCFPSGCYQIVPASDPRVFPEKRAVRHWTFPATDSGISEAEAVDRIRDTLDRAVRTHLVSDVPVGIFLSSGLDSTVVASLAVKYAPDIRTFTVAMSDDARLDESGLAERTAEVLGARHETLRVTMSDAERLVVDWFRDMDQPTMDGLNTYMISKAVREAGVTVALSGQGGDELFGGYPSFGNVLIARRIVRAARWIPRGIRGGLAGMCCVGRPVVVREKSRDLLMTDGSLTALYFHFRRMMTDRQMARLGMAADSLGLTSSYVPPGEVECVNGYDLDSTELVSRLESHFYLGNMLLRDGDVFGMAHPLEIRVPMLDRRMLDLLYAIRGSVRLPRGKPTKHLLRTAFAGYFRPELTAQTKRGFTLPIATWMRGTLRDMCLSGLEVLKESGSVRSEAVDAVWNGFVRDSSDREWTRAWTLSVLGIYLGCLRDLRAIGTLALK